MSSAQFICFAASLGIVSHRSFFIHGEHHLHAARIFHFFALLALLICCVETVWYAGHFWKAQLAASKIIFTYASGLFGSMVLYRVFLHPLRVFPGPHMAKISKFWNVMNAAHSTNYGLMEDMRQSYGDFVRTGKGNPILLEA